MSPDEVREIIRNHQIDSGFYWTIWYDRIWLDLPNESLNHGRVAEWLRSGLQNR